MKTQKQRIFSILAILSLVVILSFIFVACNSKGDQSSEKPDMEATEIYKSVDPSVAFLLVQKKDGSYASGSGFFIDPHGTLVTNYHVIEDGIKCAVQMKNGNTVEVKTVVSYDEDADLAILATNVANTKPITESKSLPQVGETVYAIGYPEAFKLGIASSTFTSGIVSSYRTMDGNEYIQSTVNITHGNSGGVLINKKGDVVGITSSGITYGDIDYMNLSIPISKIHNLAVQSNEPLDVVTARHYPVYATFYAHDLVFDIQELVYGNTAHYPGTVQKEGYTFDGWYADKAFTQEWDFSTQITKDTAIFAKLDLIYFSLNLDLNGGIWASNNPGDKYCIKDCEKALPIPKKTGYMFDGWTDSNGNYIDNYPSYSNARALTLTANWVEGTPGLTFQFNDDGTATVTACDKSKSNIVIQATYRGYKVTSIASSAFADCKSLQSVKISENISNIDSYAFDNCTSLRSIVWKPTEKVTFGSYVFRNCTNINLIIDDSVTYIADNAFKYQTWFSSITIPDSLTSIGSSAFYESSDLTNVYYTGDIASWCKISGIGRVMSTSTTLFIGGNKVCGDLTIPDGVTSIPACAFYNCSGLTSVTIPDSVTSIGYSAFSSCTGLTGITIPDSVTSIGESAFYNCTSLSTVNWNATACSSAGSYSYPIFKGCSNLTTIYIGNNVTIIPSYVFYGCSEPTGITIPDSVTSIGNYAFYNCSGLTSVTIPDSVTSIGSDAFKNCYRLVEVYNKSSLPITAGSSDNGYVAYDAKNVYTTEGGSKLLTDEKGYVIYADGDEKILVAYTGTETELVLPSYVTEIYQYAFNNCSGLTSISIPDSVTSIGGYAFNNCSGLTSVTIPDSLTSIGNSAFSSCSGLTSVTIPDSLTSIGNSAFSSCSGLTSITIPDSVTSIGRAAFYNCSSLTSITLPFVGTSKTASNGYDQVFGYIFGYATTNSSSSAISGATYQHYDGNSTRYYYYIPSSIKSVTITGGKIPYHAFYNCSKLTNVTIPDSVTSIGSSAFYGCSSLESITLPFVGASVTANNGFDQVFGYIFGYTIRSSGSSSVSGATYQYYNGNSLYYYYIPSSIKSVTITGGEIPHYAFYNCSGLTSITIPDSLTSIGSSAFDGTAWYNNQPDGLVYVGKVAYKYKGAMPSNTSIVIKDGTIGIEDYAFSGCTGLTSITIPDRVTSIGSSAFSGCSGLTSVTIPDSVTCIGNSAFYNCRGLTNITIPNSVTSIGKDAFYGCDKLQYIYITDIATWCNISGLGNLMRYGASNKKVYINNELATSVTIPDGVTSIPSYAFSGCTCLTSITILDSVTSIGSGVFNGCSGLTSITIPDSVTSIGSGVFNGCSGLTSITLPFVGASKTASDGYYQVFGYIFGMSSYTGGVATKQYYYDSSISMTRSTTYYIPSSLKSVTVTGGNIFYGAFNNCSGLTSVTIGDSVTSIGSSAFGDCSGLTSVTIGNGVTSIGSYAFEDCRSLTSVTIGNSVTSIGHLAFSYCSGLTNIYYIGNVASWCGISGLNNLMSTSRTLYIGGNKVDGNITIPDGVTNIGSYAFYGCSDLTSVTIENSVTSIGSYAFFGCAKLKTVFYAGTEEQWKAIAIGSNNSSLTSANRYYYSEERPTTTGNYWHYDEDGVTPVIWE